MSTQIRRREFIVALAAALAGHQQFALAQAPSGQRRLGVLLIGTRESRAAQMVDYARWLDQLGWKKSINLDLEYRWASGSPQDLHKQAAELAGSHPDAILVESTAAVAAMRQLAPAVPIVFVMVGDPVGSGFVNSFAHPGGTITGFSNFEPSMGGKWLEVLKEAVPAIKSVGVLAHPDQISHVNYWHSAEAAARVLGVGLTRLELRSAEDIEPAFDKLPGSADRGLMVLPHLITASNRKAIIQLAAERRIPAVYGVRFFAKDGGLVSYGVDSQDLFRRAFGYVDRILRGEKPSELPVQAPVKFELAINLKTAKVLGVEIPPIVLAQADEVIE
jgi:putative ABC transport system substrate-binding protein